MAFGASKHSPSPDLKLQQRREAENLRKILGYYGSKTVFKIIPNDYLVLRVETTGTNSDEDWPIDVCVLEVKARSVVGSLRKTINWKLADGKQLPGGEYRRIKEKLRWLSDIIAERGAVWPYTPGHLEKAGVSPLELKEVLEKLAGCPAVIGYNAVFMDWPILLGAAASIGFEKQARDADLLLENRLWDLSCIDKAAMYSMLPDQRWPDLLSFCRSAKEQQAGTFTPIRQAIEKYQLSQYRTVKDPWEYNAEEAAYFTYHLFEHWRFLEVS